MQCFFFSVHGYHDKPGKKKKCGQYFGTVSNQNTHDSRRLKRLVDHFDFCPSLARRCCTCSKKVRPRRMRRARRLSSFAFSMMMSTTWSVSKMLCRRLSPARPRRQPRS